MADKNPSEVARETLRMLAARKLLPTPENFTSLFHEIAGTSPANLGAIALAQAISETDGDPKTIRLAKAAAAAGDFKKAIALMCDPAAKRESATAQSETGRSALLADLHEQIARLLEFAVPALGEDDAKIVPDALALAEFCRANATSGSLAPLKSKISTFNHRLSFVAEDQAEIRKSLLSMLRLVFENIAELSLDDRWLHGQVELLMSASKPPLTLRRLDDLERRLKDVIFKQGELKRRAIENQEQMKQLLATFMEKLSEMAELSGSTHEKIESCAKRIESAKNLADIGPALNEAIGATRALAHEAAKARDELRDMKRKADESSAEIAKLKRELDQASSAARHDQLTGALNRKGLDEAIEREASRARRQQTPLCVALLDIDNFKAINDIHGHQTGDAALAHLAQVARDAMRPQDTLSRYGGEEFVIIMPDTLLEGGIVAMTRLQRDLTRKFFMSGHDKLLITFSAGVTQMTQDESPRLAIERADQGMYQAKRTGKNKVVAA